MNLTSKPRLMIYGGAAALGIVVCGAPEPWEALLYFLIVIATHDYPQGERAENQGSVVRQENTQGKTTTGQDTAGGGQGGRHAPAAALLLRERGSVPGAKKSTKDRGSAWGDRRKPSQINQG